MFRLLNQQLSREICLIVVLSVTQRNLGNHIGHSSLRVILSDTEHLLRDVLKAFLHIGANHEVVGEATGGVATLHLVEKLDPDVLVLDLELCGPMNGIEVVKRLRVGSRGVRIVVLTDLVDSVHVAQAFRAGAHAYVSKKAPGAELLRAIEVVSGGGRYVSHGVEPPLGLF
jgi:DNA-binding NarL/FixJ family response regulator